VNIILGVTNNHIIVNINFVKVAASLKLSIPIRWTGGNGSTSYRISMTDDMINVVTLFGRSKLNTEIITGNKV